jgi:hypothetical protein
MPHANRESWLQAAVDKLSSAIFGVKNFVVPQVRISIGFPSRRGLASKHQTIGECWAAKAAADGKSQVFISPTLDNPIEALAVLVHELVHATVGVEHGHKGPFSACAKAVGLEGKMTSTHAGEDLKVRLAGIATGLGDYPHAALNPDLSGKKKQSTRMLKAQCPQCGYTVRLTKTWAEMGLPTCGLCKVTFQMADGSLEGEEE